MTVLRRHRWLQGGTAAGALPKFRRGGPWRSWGAAATVDPLGLELGGADYLKLVVFTQRQEFTYKVGVDFLLLAVSRRETASSVGVRMGRSTR